MKLFTK